MRPYLQLTGFLLFLTGLLSLVLNLVGMRFSFLRFLETMSGPWQLSLHLIVIFGGMVLFYLASQGDSFKN